MTDTKQPEALRLDAPTNRRYPEHCRTSCSDADPCNYDIDGTGCHRCNAFFFAKAEENERRIAELEAENRALKEQSPSFQQRVQPWLLACFGPEIAADKAECMELLIDIRDAEAKACRTFGEYVALVQSKRGE